MRENKNKKKMKTKLRVKLKSNYDDGISLSISRLPRRTQTKSNTRFMIFSACYIIGMNDSKREKSKRNFHLSARPEINTYM